MEPEGRDRKLEFPLRDWCDLDFPNEGGPLVRCRELDTGLDLEGLLEKLLGGNIPGLTLSLERFLALE